MLKTTQSPQPATTETEPTKIFVSLELSNKEWLVSSKSPGNGSRTSVHSVNARDMSMLTALLGRLQAKARARTGAEDDYPIVVIYEAGMDGFWIQRSLEQEGVTCRVVDPASIPMPRRARQVKTDRIDGEVLLRCLLSHELQWPRISSMVHVPSVKQEDERRICRERERLVNERGQHTSRIKSLLKTVGIADYQPFRRDRRKQLDELRTPNGNKLPENMKDEILRELERLELVAKHIKAVDDKRDALVTAKIAADEAAARPSPLATLLNLKGIGVQFAFVLWCEGFFRRFDNRGQVASYAGLTPSPWQSGTIDRVQGVSKSGNPRLRRPLIQLAWLWLRHQPNSALSLWFNKRLVDNGGRRKRTLIVALARKLLVALWQYATCGLVIEGAVMKRS